MENFITQTRSHFPTSKATMPAALRFSKDDCPFAPTQSRSQKLIVLNALYRFEHQNNYALFLYVFDMIKKLVPWVKM